ncbi:TPR-like protein [Rhizoctonia solani]|uniref:TPR-like protein n=1 Tax=Rhizoctonia solani TaxID=456999 RepID=A0A8H7H887_9AGAM|nr:TPR-like protein [Rhizoctonia solani]
MDAESGEAKDALTRILSNESTDETVPGRANSEAGFCMFVFNPSWTVHEMLFQLGASYIKHFQRSHKLDDIEKSIQYLSSALTLTPEGHPDLPDRHANLGVSFAERYDHLDEIGDLEKAIESDSRALALTPEDHPDLPIRCSKLGLSYGDRYKRFGRLEDLNESIKYRLRALMLTPEAHPNLPDRQVALGTAYTTRYERLGEVSDIEKAIECRFCAMMLTPEDHPKLSDRYAALAISYHDRYSRFSQLSDLEKTIEYAHRALELTPEGHSGLPDRHTNLGVAYSDRSRRLGELNDFEKTIKHSYHALMLTPDDHPDLPAKHSNLGVSYRDRYERLGELTDLEKSITCFSRAFEFTPNSHPGLPDRYAALGLAYGDRYQRTGELADLKKATESLSNALTLTPNGHPNLPARHAGLGISYSERYRRFGELADLEKVIECFSDALMLTPEGHPDIPIRHADLGTSYNDRFQRLGEFADLEKSITCFYRALTLTPEGHPDLPGRFAYLGMSYSNRYKYLGEYIDLEEAIKYNLRALMLTSRDHPKFPERLAAVGGSYNDWHLQFGELVDLEKAIEFKSRALELTPDSHPILPDRHSTLGVAYAKRYQRLGELSDLKKAMEHFSRALTLTPDTHPDSSLRYDNWALYCFLQYQQTHDTSHLDASLCSFRKASQLSNGPPRDAFRSALRWANLASCHGHLNLIEAFRTTIDLLPHYIWLGATTNQRYYDLLPTQDLAVRAASAAILSSEYALALEWLEHARCVVWNQSLMLRSPVDILQASHPDLATELRSVAQQLHHANSQPSTPRLVTDTSDHRHHLARVYNDLIVQVRTLPGFEDFLLPTKSNELVKAARNGPVVVINCEENRCDALLVLPGSTDIKHVHLPGFTGAKAQHIRFEMEKSIRNRRPSERGIERRPVKEEIDFEQVLKDLWYDIVKPVLDFLGYMHKDNIAPDNIPHITWCPTGALSFLPLHAAGDYDQSRSRVFDYVISSYTPTLTTLRSCSPSVLNHGSRALIIGQEATPGHQELPGTAKELECVVRHMQGRIDHSQLLGSQATVAAVLDAMEQHDWVHLACHAHQNVQDPTDSGFFLHDGTLDLASINQRSLKNKGLAFLSACQTAAGDRQLPDEAVHLASGMLTAGYSSVVATMWSVYDDDAPVVADKVYAQLMKDRKIGNGEAGRALHNAIGELRDKVGEKEYSRWVPYIHIGA